MTIIGMIPARYGSSRFPGKPLVPILGKTLIQRTFENAQQIASLDKLIIATDDRRIAEHAAQFGAEVVMTGDCLTGTDRLAEVLQNDFSYLKASAIVNIQGDEPLLDPHAVEEAIALLLNDPAASMATVVTPLKTEEEAFNPSIVKCVKDLQNNALYFSRTLIPSNKMQQFHLGNNYYRHLGVYVYRPDFLLQYQKLPPSPLQLAEDLEQLKVLEYGYRIKVAVADYAGIGVDTPDDLKKIEQFLEAEICKQNSSL